MAEALYALQIIYPVKVAPFYFSPSQWRDWRDSMNANRQEALVWNFASLCYMNWPEAGLVTLQVQQWMALLHIFNRHLDIAWQSFLFLFFRWSLDGWTPVSPDHIQTEGTSQVSFSYFFPGGCSGCWRSYEILECRLEMILTNLMYGTCRTCGTPTQKVFGCFGQHRSWSTASPLASWGPGQAQIFTNISDN